MSEDKLTLPGLVTLSSSPAKPVVVVVVPDGLRLALGRGAIGVKAQRAAGQTLSVTPPRPVAPAKRTFSAAIVKLSWIFNAPRANAKDQYDFVLVCHVD